MRNPCFSVMCQACVLERLAGCHLACLSFSHPEASGSTDELPSSYELLSFCPCPHRPPRVARCTLCNTSRESSAAMLLSLDRHIVHSMGIEMSEERCGARLSPPSLVRSAEQPAATRFLRAHRVSCSAPPS